VLHSKGHSIPKTAGRTGCCRVEGDEHREETAGALGRGSQMEERKNLGDQKSQGCQDLGCAERGIPVVNKKRDRLLFICLGGRAGEGRD